MMSQRANRPRATLGIQRDILGRAQIGSTVRTDAEL